ncbi:MAG: cellulase family glycosylhydrolase [Chloroflexi bacterium]|nr:cellulase family glycosylhydrolase [Chloroflexota bacterium]
MPFSRLALGLLAAVVVLAAAATQPGQPAAAIDAPKLAAPANAVVLPNLGPTTLTWTNPVGTTQVQVQVRPANDDGPGVNLILGTATTFAIPGPRFGQGGYLMLPGMNYTWRVRATDKVGFAPESDPAWGPWTPGFTFRTPVPTSAGLQPANPPHGAVIAELTPTLRWTDAASDIFYYEVQLSQDSTFETAPDKAIASVYWNLVHGGVTDPPNSYRVPANAPLEPGVIYFWRVRPRVQGDGTPVAWSQTFNFRTQGDFRYGLNGGFDRTDKVKEMGFDWLKWIVYWKDLEPQPGQYMFKERLDFTINRLQTAGVKVMIRVDETPDWASTRPGNKNAPPKDDAAFGEFMGKLAGYLKGKVDAFEIWNEPNLNYEWGNTDPDPIRYGQMLKAAYPKIKAANPNAIVITGGLSTTGDGESGPYLGDLYYLAKLMDPNMDGNPADGFGAYFDAVGTHPYGGPYAAATSPADGAGFGTYFRRAEEQYAIVQKWGKVAKPFWATEFGWFTNPAEEGLTCDVGDHFSKMVVSSEFQGQQLAAAYQYARKNWPWMKAMFFFNFDSAGDSWRPPCEQVRFFSIMKGDGSFRSGFNLLKSMPK